MRVVTDGLDDTVQLSAYLAMSTTAAQAKQAVAAIEAKKGVGDAVLVSPDEGLAEFRKLPASATRSRRCRRTRCRGWSRCGPCRRTTRLRPWKRWRRSSQGRERGPRRGRHGLGATDPRDRGHVAEARAAGRRRARGRRARRRRQHDPPRDQWPARGDRSDQAGRRQQRLRAPTLPLLRPLAGTRRRAARSRADRRGPRRAGPFVERLAAAYGTTFALRGLTREEWLLLAGVARCSA